MLWLLKLIICIGNVCFGEEFQAWYIPSDKLSKAPKSDLFEKNEDVYIGFSLKKPLFSGLEYEQEVSSNVFVYP